MSAEKIKLIFSDLKNEVITEKQAEQKVLELFTGVKVKDVDTSIISEFATKHQKEYQKDITFTVSKSDDSPIIIVAVLHTVFGDFMGHGTNQKIAKINAVKLANEAWD